MKIAFWRFFMIPSSYGFVIWTGLLLLTQANLINVDISEYAWVIFIYLLFCFLISNFIFFNLFKKVDINNIGENLIYQKIDTFIFISSTLTGLFGLFLYIRDFAVVLGGIPSFFLIFFIDPLVIRALAAEETSLGFQISYFSWVSIYYCIFLLSKGEALIGWKRVSLVLLLVVEVFLNLLFVDRTRPIILLVICFLTFILIALRRLKNPFYILGFAFFTPLLIFFGQAIFTGKYDLEEGLFHNFLVYVFGGFGYFSATMRDALPDYELTRSFYPFSKVLQAIGLVSEVPDQILEFRDVPFTTNVGTFLEPIFSDGGIVLLVIGIPFVVFLTDCLAYFAIKSKDVFGVFIWGNLVLITILSFFVPKYNSTSLYLFFIIYILAFFGGRLKMARLNEEIV